MDWESFFSILLNLSIDSFPVIRILRSNTRLILWKPQKELDQRKTGTKYTVVLEDLRSQFKVFGEGLHAVRKKGDETFEAVGELKEDVAVMKEDVGASKRTCRSSKKSCILSATTSKRR